MVCRLLSYTQSGELRVRIDEVVTGPHSFPSKLPAFVRFECVLGDLGPWFLVPGSVLLVLSFLVLGSWFLVFGFGFLVLGSWFLVPPSQSPRTP